MWLGTRSPGVREYDLIDGINWQRLANRFGIWKKFKKPRNNV